VEEFEFEYFPQFQTEFTMYLHFKIVFAILVLSGLVVLRNVGRLFWSHVRLVNLHEFQRSRRNLSNAPCSVDGQIFDLVNHDCFEMMKISLSNIQKNGSSLTFQQNWHIRNCEKVLKSLSKDACPRFQQLQAQRTEHDHSVQTLSQKNLTLLQILCACFSSDISEEVSKTSSENVALCFESMNTFGIEPGKSWGSATLAQQDIWKAKDCDNVIQANIRKKCSRIFTDNQPFHVGNLPLTIKSNWDELKCVDFFIERPSLDCFEVMKTYDILPGRSWGSASKDIKDTWRNKNCDVFVQSNSQDYCLKIHSAFKTYSRVQMPVQARKEWDQFYCNRFFTQQMNSKYPAAHNQQMRLDIPQTLTFSSNTGQMRNRLAKFPRESTLYGVPETSQMGGKPARFPRESTLYEVLPAVPESGFRKQVNVVLWNDFSGFLLWGTDSFRKTAQEKCSTDCKIHLRSEMDFHQPDAFLVHAKTHMGDFPKINDVHSKFILVSLEQPGYAARMADPFYLARFDFYTTYQLDSFVPLTYIEPEWKLEDFYLPHLPLSHKNGLVAIFISNCKNGGASKRTEYVRELMNHIQVDSYGGCLRNYNEENRLLESGVHPENLDRKQRKNEILKRYKFYLAFENAQVLDYTSEKVFEGLIAGALPVYRGSSSVEMLLPHKSSIINANSMNPLELAQYLQEVASNDQLYNSYFEWKNLPISHNFTKVFEHAAHSYTSMCHICQKLSES